MLSGVTSRLGAHGGATGTGPHRIELFFRDLSLNQGFFPQDLDINKFRPYLAATVNDNAVTRAKTKTQKWSGGFTGARLGFEDRLVLNCDCNRDNIAIELWDDGSGLAGMLAKDRLLGKAILPLNQLLASNQLLDQPLTLLPVEGPSGLASTGSTAGGTGEHVGLRGRLSNLVHGGGPAGSSTTGTMMGQPCLSTGTGAAYGGAPAGYGAGTGTATSGNIIGQTPGGGVGTTGGITGSNAVPIGGMGGVATVLVSCRLLEGGLVGAQPGAAIAGTQVAEKPAVGATSAQPVPTTFQQPMNLGQTGVASSSAGLQQGEGIKYPAGGVASGTTAGGLGTSAGIGTASGSSAGLSGTSATGSSNIGQQYNQY